MADNADSPKFRSRRPDLATITGMIVAVAAILGGLVLDGGKVADVQQSTAALIVLGGTLGAVLVTSPLSSLMGALAGLKSLFFEDVIDTEAAIEAIVGYATKARKSSVISLEEELDKIDDPFLKKALTLAVDGTDLHELKNMVELDLIQAEKRVET